MIAHDLPPDHPHFALFEAIRTGHPLARLDPATTIAMHVDDLGVVHVRASDIQRIIDGAISQAIRLAIDGVQQASLAALDFSGVPAQ